MRDAHQKTEALGHVGYELWMLAAASVRLVEAHRFGDGIGQNAYLEDALLHARALIDFFIKPTRFASDISRTDFAPEWTPTPAEAVERLNAHYPLLHKCLAHLTWERVDEGAHEWDYPNIAADVLNVAAAWSKQLALVDHEMWTVFQPSVFLAKRTLVGPPEGR